MKSVRFLGLMFLALISSVLVGGSLLFARMLMDTGPVVRVVKSQVTTQDVRACGKVEIEQMIDYMRDCGGHVDRWLFDCCGGRKQLQAVNYLHPPEGLGVKTIRFSEDVPCNFREGTARYVATPAYWCNPVQRWWTPITRPGNKSTSLPFPIIK